MLAITRTCNKMSVLSAFVLKLVDKIAEDAGFTGYSIVCEPGSKPNDGLIATLTRVKVHRDQQTISNINTLHLMCKLMPENAAHCKEWHTVLLFEREVLMYTKILPAFLQFQRERGLSDSECFISYPKCYAAVADATKNEYAIIMEDLRSQEFVMWNCEVPPPLNHLVRIVGEIAKFHAISFALKDQRPLEYAEFKNTNDLLLMLYEAEGMSTMQDEAIDQAIAVLDNSEHAAPLRDLKKNNLSLMRKLLKEGLCEPYGVIGHGDCWSNNHLYRYTDGV